MSLIDWIIKSLEASRDIIDAEFIQTDLVDMDISEEAQFLNYQFDGLIERENNWIMPKDDE